MDILINSELVTENDRIIVKRGSEEIILTFDELKDIFSLMKFKRLAYRYD
jgi:hypothetical protein